MRCAVRHGPVPSVSAKPLLGIARRSCRQLELLRPLRQTSSAGLFASDQEAGGDLTHPGRGQVDFSLPTLVGPARSIGKHGASRTNRWSSLMKIPALLRSSRLSYENCASLEKILPRQTPPVYEKTYNLATALGTFGMRQGCIWLEELSVKTGHSGNKLICP